MPTKANVAALLCLPLSAGCSWLCPKPQTITEYVTPPAVLLQTREQPVLNGDTWGDIAQHAVDLREWGAACELDRAQIRTFVEQSQEGPSE